MSPLSKQSVPYEGPEDSNILFVGESPGGEEIGQGRPFVGRAGQLLERYLERNGHHRSSVRLANLCNHRPLPDNKFVKCLNTPELEAGLEKLADEITRNKPNCIVALGSWPMFFLTGFCGSRNGKEVPGSGILTYRGSRLPALPRFGGGKVFATMHPSFVLRNWKYNPIFDRDIRNAVFDSAYPSLNYPDYKTYIDPDSDVLYDLTHQAISSPYISMDIETFKGGTFSCIGFAPGDEWGATVTFQRQDLVRFVKEIWESDTPKIFQYGTYDLSFMEFFYQWKLGGYHGPVGWDTYVASASLLPDYPRGLDFLVSLYTRFPYYKSERKVWRENDDLNMLFNYNIKDVIATYQVAVAQMADMKELYGLRP